MAHQLIASVPAANFTRLQPRSCISLVGSFSMSNSNGFCASPVQCTAANATSVCEKAISNRRSANYQPSMWGYDYLQSLSNEYVVESYAQRIEKLKGEVWLMLENKEVDYVDALHQLEIVDNLQRLGVSYHFEDEIKRFLSRIYNERNSRSSYHAKEKQESSLYAVALEFRLLRQHGFDMHAQGTLSLFMDEKGKFKSCLGDDIKGILALYEAAYLLVEEESNIFNEAINFTTTHLKEYVKHNNNDDDGYLSTLVEHALELPLHWRMVRLEARWFIDMYQRGPDVNQVLVELAKLDFNAVQAAHQEELKYVSTWWRKTGLGELHFARDRIMENFFWALGEVWEPQFEYCRRMSTKVNALITTIDDVYDVYGTLDELELFTNAVERWDVKAMDQLPYYMKQCFHVLHNSTNEMAFDVLKDQGVHVIPYLKKVWADMCKSFLLEAKWYSSGYIPTLEEYMDNAWISVSGPVILLHAYNLIANPPTNEALQFLEEYPNIIRWPSMIFRLANDLATSSDEVKRGDVPKAIQCYMHETGASESDAREHIRDLITATWMKMNNKDGDENPDHLLLSNNFIRFAMNLARMAQCTYQNGDGHTIQHKSKNRVLPLLVHPVSLINL
ncbi:gamma-terpinene synthase, chloroplastic-like [Citrus clementina]|uniref:gamma-terpinene synthase, chloroplastic-like n=1 Tax=Citrus clementina TaxID=85681 RepID=UPI000CED608F|nr:gamma-terpinene synthase, chloroplastic-like [Citrus x clementina]